MKKHMLQASIKIAKELDDFTLPCRIYVDISLAKDELGYKPEFTPLEALNGCIAYAEVMS